MSSANPYGVQLERDTLELELAKLKGVISLALAGLEPAALTLARHGAGDMKDGILGPTTWPLDSIAMLRAAIGMPELVPPWPDPIPPGLGTRTLDAIRRVTDEIQDQQMAEPKYVCGNESRFHAAIAGSPGVATLLPRAIVQPIGGKFSVFGIDVIVDPLLPAAVFAIRGVRHLSVFNLDTGNAITLEVEQFRHQVPSMDPHACALQLGLLHLGLPGNGSFDVKLVRDGEVSHDHA